MTGQSVNPTRGLSRNNGRRHEIADSIVEQFELDTPGVLTALSAIFKMRCWGVKITPEIAKSCVKWHVQNEADFQKRMQDRIELNRRLNRHESLVYYMLLGNRVKIGFSTNLKVRKDAIQPEVVIAVEPGDALLERERHLQFDDLREQGEWFRYESPLIEHVEQIRETALSQWAHELPQPRRRNRARRPADAGDQRQPLG